MIIESLVGYACYLIQSVFSLLQVVTLPLDAMTILADIFCYGVWIVGADLMGIILATISGWLTFKLLAGLVIFIWRLLPLT